MQHLSKVVEYFSLTVWVKLDIGENKNLGHRNPIDIPIGEIYVKFMIHKL